MQKWFEKFEDVLSYIGLALLPLGLLYAFWVLQ